MLIFAHFGDLGDAPIILLPQSIGSKPKPAAHHRIQAKPVGQEPRQHQSKQAGGLCLSHRLPRIEKEASSMRPVPRSKRYGSIKAFNQAASHTRISLKRKTVWQGYLRGP